MQDAAQNDKRNTAKKTQLNKITGIVYIHAISIDLWFERIAHIQLQQSNIENIVYIPLAVERQLQRILIEFDHLRL